MSDGPFGDIPLFQELQRLLSSGSGPVNMEIATQIAKAQVKDEGRPAPAKAREMVFAEDVRNAEMLLSGYTRLSVEEPARATLITPSRWVDETLQGWRWLFEAFAASFTRTMTERGEEGAAVMMGPVVPLLMGLQVGTLVGQLAGDALGRFDLPIPRDDDGKLFLVERNADKVAEDYDFDSADFTLWLAIRETARNLIFSGAPWALRYLRAAFTELVESIEIDLGEIEGMLAGLQTGGMEAMSELKPPNALPLVETPRHNSALERVGSFISLFEGYSAHAGSAVSAQTISTGSRIEEGMTRRAVSPSEGEAALPSILGLSFDKRSVARGKTFCDAVAGLHGMQALNQVWGAPDNLPNAEELRDPFVWMERVLESDAG